MTFQRAPAPRRHSGTVRALTDFCLLSRLLLVDRAIDRLTLYAVLRSSRTLRMDRAIDHLTPCTVRRFTLLRFTLLRFTL